MTVCRHDTFRQKGILMILTIAFRQMCILINNVKQTRSCTVFKLNRQLGISATATTSYHLLSFLSLHSSCRKCHPILIITLRLCHPSETSRIYIFYRRRGLPLIKLCSNLGEFRSLYFFSFFFSFFFNTSNIPPTDFKWLKCSVINEPNVQLGTVKLTTTKMAAVVPLLTAVFNDVKLKTWKAVENISLFR